MNALKNMIRLLRPEVEEINGGRRCPTYLYRWELLALFGGRIRVYLHKFVGDDWAIDLHDHPKRFVSIGISGRYTEHRPGGLTVEYTAPWVRQFGPTHRHRLTGPTQASPCWTMVIVGPPVRDWGFWVQGKFVDWRSHVAPGSGASTTCEGV